MMERTETKSKNEGATLVGVKQGQCTHEKRKREKEEKNRHDAREEGKERDFFWGGGFFF